MTDILLCRQPMTSAGLAACGVPADALIGADCSRPTQIKAFSPYLFTGQQASHAEQAILSTLAPEPSARALTNFALALGGENVVALAKMRKTLQEYNVGLVGASTSVYANRIGSFAGAVKEYQDALLAYRQTVVAKSPLKASAKQTAQAAFHKMQIRFRQELGAASAVSKSRRGTPLTSAERATNIAMSSRSVAKLNVASQIQASNLVRFTQHAKMLGNGVAVIDFGTRIGNVHNSYQAGEQWERELFIESSSFAASAITGVAAVNMGAAALTFLVVATPVGWVGLVIGGVAVAGVSAAAAMGMNSAIKSNSGAWYDGIMQWLERK